MSAEQFDLNATDRAALVSGLAAQGIGESVAGRLADAIIEDDVETFRSILEAELATADEQIAELRAALETAEQRGNDVVATQLRGQLEHLETLRDDFATDVERLQELDSDDVFEWVVVEAREGMNGQ